MFLPRCTAGQSRHEVGVNAALKVSVNRGRNGVKQLQLIQHGEGEWRSAAAVKRSSGPR